MFRKIAFTIIFVTCTLIARPAFGQNGDTASLRILNLDTSSVVVAATLESGQRIASNLASGSTSDYTTLAADESSFLSITFAPNGTNGTNGSTNGSTNNASFTREWSVPPLSAGHHTAAVVGRSTDITLQLVFIAEDTLCEGKLANGTCLIVINNVSGLPPVTLLAGGTQMVANASYRHVLVNDVPARSYLSIRGVDAANPDNVLMQLPRGYFAPNVISFFTLTGTYSAGAFSNATVGTFQRVPVDSMTFLRSLTGDLQLTGGDKLVATENVVAILEMAGFDQLLANAQLPLTLFAPTDEAVVAAADLYQCAIANPAALRTLILNHIVTGSYTPSQLVAAGQLPSLSGTTHRFRSANGGVTIDNTFVPDSAAYPTANGSVYLIDDVLVPPGFENQYCTSG